MRPTSSSVVYRPDLNVFASEYDAEQGEQLFIGSRAAPLFYSAECSGTYEYCTRESFRKRATTTRAANGAYNRITGSFSQGTFDCKENGLEYRVDDRKARQWGSVFNAEAAATRILRRQILLSRESRVATIYTGAGLTNHNVATAWSTVATAVPLTDIITGCNTVRNKTGIPRSQMTVIMPEADYQELLNTTQVINKVQYTFGKALPAELDYADVARMLGIRELLVAASSYDSTAEGETESNSMFWAAGVIYIVVLCRDGDGWEIPSAARTVLWTGDSPEAPVMESYREDNTRADIVRMREDTAEKLTMETDLLAYQLTNT